MKINRRSFVERPALRFRRIGSLPSAGSNRGFTLIELLVTIAIIAVLGSLLFPLFGKIQRSTNSVKCANNLRQIGMAVLSYAADHDGVLPGPANSGQAAECPSTGSPYQLIYILANYLGPYGPPVAPYTVRPNTWYCPTFECPAARKVILVQNKTLTGAIYYVTTYLLFGYPPNIAQPMRLATITSLQTMVVMKDADQTFYGQGAPTVAAAPAHGSYRNTLYLDGHVEAIPVKP